MLRRAASPASPRPPSDADVVALAIGAISMAVAAVVQTRVQRHGQPAEAAVLAAAAGPAT